MVLLGPKLLTELLTLDERKLAKQWDKTGSFMDLCCDETWVCEAARVEEECDGRVEAGLAMRAYATAKYDPALDGVRHEMRRKMRLQSILFVELKRWMTEWDIGLAFEETYTEARRLVRAHLKQPSPALDAWVEAVIEEDTHLPEEADKPVRSQTKAQLSLMMSEEDWETLARVAATAAADIVSTSVRQAGKVEQKFTGVV
ncbi:MAG: hypothetical protein AAF810_18215 [Cyanobacteria bacterium P01_D01_bin.36]